MGRCMVAAGHDNGVRAAGASGATSFTNPGRRRAAPVDQSTEIRRLVITLQ